MGASSKLRMSVILAILALAVLALVWVWKLTAAVNAPQLPRLDAAGLASLTDSVDDRQRLLVHLTALRWNGHDLQPWDSLQPAARPVLSTLTLERGVESGSGAFGQAAEPGEPGPADAAEGYAALGETEIAGVVRQLAAGAGDRPRALARFQALLPRAQQARLAFLRKHAEALAQ